MTSSNSPTFAPGSVGETLSRLHGIWHDRVALYELDGTHLGDDSEAGAGSPGASPFENLVYIDFDGERLSLTNVTFRGRPATAKTFTGRMQDGLFRFDPIGPGAIDNVGVSGGPGVLVFNPTVIDARWDVYLEPDFIMLTGKDERVRTTVLYRHGEAQRTLTARGIRLSHDCSQRHDWDPRGPDGPVHEALFQTNIWAGEKA